MTAARQWSHGDQPTAAMMTLYSTALTEAHDSLGDVAVNPLYRKVSEAEFTIRHTLRYLHFTSTGAVVDPAGVGKEVGLSEDGDTGKGVLDLESVSWLAYGSLYWVTGVSACVEDWEP
jgi:hypothetical protein